MVVGVLVPREEPVRFFQSLKAEVSEMGPRLVEGAQEGFPPTVLHGVDRFRKHAPQHSERFAFERVFHGDGCIQRRVLGEEPPDEIQFQAIDGACEPQAFGSINPHVPKAMAQDHGRHMGDELDDGHHPIVLFGGAHVDLEARSAQHGHEPLPRGFVHPSGADDHGLADEILDVRSIHGMKAHVPRGGPFHGLHGAHLQGANIDHQLTRSKSRGQAFQDFGGLVERHTDDDGIRPIDHVFVGERCGHIGDGDRVSMVGKEPMEELSHGAQTADDSDAGCVLPATKIRHAVRHDPSLRRGSSHLPTSDLVPALSRGSGRLLGCIVTPLLGRPEDGAAYGLRHGFEPIQEGRHGLRRQGLGSVAQGFVGSDVHFQHEPVGAGRNGRAGHGGDEIGPSQGVAGIHDDGQMGEFFSAKARR